MASRIFLISQTESILTNRGKRHPDLAKYLVDNNYELLYISSNYYHAEKRFFSPTEIGEAASRVAYRLEIIRIPGYKSNISIARVFSNLIFAYRTQKLLRGNIDKGDVVIIPSRPVELLLFVSRLKRRRGFKVILDIRDIWPDAFNINSRIFKSLFKAYCNFFLYHSIDHFDYFVHTCPSFTQWLSRYAPDEKSVFIPLGYSHTRYKSFRKVRNHDKSIHFVYIGLIQYQIDLLPFIKAIENNLTFFLTIIGDDGTGEKYKSVEDYVKVHNVTNVKQLGQMKQELIPEELLVYDVGLLPMKAEFVFPNKLFDYMASGLPILSLGDNDASRFVVENGIGWTCQFDAEKIKELLDQLSNSPEDEIQKASYKLSLISGQYSREVIFNDLLKIINHATTDTETI